MCVRGVACGVFHCVCKRDPWGDLDARCARRKRKTPADHRAEISVAVEFLISRGFGAEDIPGQLVKFYYVDIDLLNSVLVEDQILSAPLPSSDRAWKRVA